MTEKWHMKNAINFDVVIVTKRCGYERDYLNSLLK